jgi:hypothetical protein
MICSERMCLPATTIIFSFQFLPFVYWTNRDIKRCHKVTRWEEEYRCCAVAGLMLGGRMLRRYRLTLAREAIFCSCAGAVDRCASKLYQRHGCQVPTRRMRRRRSSSSAVPIIRLIIPRTCVANEMDVTIHASSPLSFLFSVFFVYTKYAHTLQQQRKVRAVWRHLNIRGYIAEYEKTNWCTLL